MHRSSLVLLALPLLAACSIGGSGIPSTLLAASVDYVAAAEDAPFAGVARVVDPSRSKVSAVGAKVTGTHAVSFPSLGGKLWFDGEKLTGLDLNLPMTGISSDHPKLTEHLKSADFFDVANFPKATFRSTRVAAQPNQPGAPWMVTGNLTIRGQTREISFPASLTSAGGEVKASAKITILRKDYGIVFAGMPDDLIKDEVPLSVEIVVGK